MSVPRRWPLLGHLPAFYADTTGFLSRLVREQGDVARFRLGRGNAVMLAHPDHVRAVLVDHASDFVKGNLIQRARSLLGDGLLTSEGDLHHAQRRCIQPARWANPEPPPPPFAYFPFGAGPRSCIGEQFARMVMVHVVTTIARSWRLCQTRPGLPALRSLLTLKPRGAVWMVAERRRG